MRGEGWVLWLARGIQCHIPWTWGLCHGRSNRGTTYHVIRPLGSMGRVKSGGIGGITIVNGGQITRAAGGVCLSKVPMMTMSIVVETEGKGISSYPKP